MRKLNIVTISGVGCFLTAQLFICLSPAHAHQSDWQRSSKHARSLVDDNDYANAVVYYNRAISELTSKEPNSEYLYDLILNLAETHIRARSYTRAQILLDRIEPDITSKEFLDPLLPVRFWRRKAKLYYMQGNFPRAIQDSTRALDLFGKFFVPSSEQYQGQLRKLIFMICESKDWQQVATFMKLVKKGETESEMFYLTTEAAAVTAMQSGDLKSAGQILSALSDIDPHKDVLIGHWNHWSDLCFKANQLPLTDIAESKIQSLIKSIVPNSKENIRALALAHYCLAAIYLRKNQLERQNDEWRRTRETLRLLGANIGESDYTLLATADMTIAVNNIKNKDFSPETQTLLLEVVELSKLPQATAKLGKWASFDWYHCLSRHFLAKFYMSKQMFDKVPPILESIDKKKLSAFSELAARGSAIRQNALNELSKAKTDRYKQ